jgi:flagellar biosynthesis GTPase FlhF
MINSTILPLMIAAAIGYPNVTYEIVTNEFDEHEVYAFEGEKYEETADHLIYTLDAGACILRDVYTHTIAREILRFNDRHYQNNHFGLDLDTSLGVCVMTILKVPNNISLSLEIGNYRNRYNQYYYYHTEAPLYFPYKIIRPRVKRAHRHHRRHHKHVKPTPHHRKHAKRHRKHAKRHRKHAKRHRKHAKRHRKHVKRHRKHVKRHTSPRKSHAKQKRAKRHKKASNQRKKTQQRRKHRNNSQNKAKTPEKHKKKGKKSRKQQKRHRKAPPRRR